MRIHYGIIILLLNILAMVSAVPSHKLTRRMSNPSPPSEQFLRDFDWNSFTQKGNGAFLSLMDALGKNLGPRWYDVHDCLRDLVEDHQVFRFMYYFMINGGAPPGYPIELIEKETVRCFYKVAEEMGSDEGASERFSPEFGEEASEEVNEEESSEGPSEGPEA